MVAVALAGLGTGCCYPLLVAIVREYFGEDAALQNFALICSAKAVGAVASIGLVVLLVSSQGHGAALSVVAVLALASAAIARLLHQPGRPPMLLPDAGPGARP